MRFFEGVIIFGLMIAHEENESGGDEAEDESNEGVHAEGFIDAGLDFGWSCGWSICLIFHIIMVAYLI